MSTNMRFLLAIIGAMIVGALSVPELASKLPPGTASIIAMAIANALHRMDSTAPPSPPAAPVTP